MHTLVPDHLFTALCWTFIHSLWQGLVLTVLAAGVMLLTRRSAAAVRYSLLCLLFFLFLGTVAVSFLIQWRTDGSFQGFADTFMGTSRPHFIASVPAQWLRQATAFLDGNAPWIVLTWLVVLLGKSGSMMLDVFYVRRLRRSHARVAPPSWEARVQVLAEGLGIRKNILLLESALVKVPVMLGHFKPVILVPLGILNRLPPGEMEAVLLHELAHIRRHDYLVNFIQRFSELFFFFNPGFLWVSSLLRVEREHCCDDMAISHTRNKLQFVEALIHCKEHAYNAQGYALGLFGRKNQLLQRLTRITGNPGKALSPVETAFFILSLAVATVLFSGMRNAIEPPAQPDPAPVAILRSPAPTPSGTTYAPAASIKKELKQGIKVTRVKSRRLPEFSAVLSPVPEQKPIPADDQEQSQLSIESVQGSGQHREASRLEHAEVDAARIQAERDRLQAEKDREQAMKDRAQAYLDRKQAEKDRIQADKDRQQAMKDREQALHDRRLYNQQ